jgi:hypothetical protein
MLLYISGMPHIKKSPAEVSAKPDWFCVRMVSSTWDLWCTTRKQRSHIPRRIRPVTWSSRAAGVFLQDYTTNQLVIKNESPFELVYKLEILGDPHSTGG